MGQHCFQGGWVQAGVLVIATLFVAANTLVDLLYGFLDPRIRYT